MTRNSASSKYAKARNTLKRRRALWAHPSQQTAGAGSNAMNDVNGAIDREMGSLRKPAYLIIAGLCFLFRLTKPSELVLLIFASAPQSAFVNNPYGGNAQTIITEWNLTESRSWIPGFTQSLFYVGFMPGTIIFGQFSDYVGRRSVAWKGYALVLIVQILTGFCQNWQQLAICRTIRGFVTGGLSVVENIMMQEMSGSQMWVFNGAVLGGLTFALNTFVFIIFAYYFPSWRTLYFVTAIPGVLGFLYFILCPESPRWLVSQGKVKKAEKVICRLANWNGIASAHADYQYLEQEQDEAADGNVKNSETSTMQTKRGKKSVFDLIKNPILRPRTLIMGLQWFTASFVYYCFTLGSGVFNPNFYLANIISSLSQLPAVPLVLILMERKWAGRRRSLTGFTFASAIATFVMYIVTFTEEQSSYKLVLLLLGKLGVSCAFDLIYIYTAEIFPTDVRNVGLGAMSTCARVGGILAPYLVNVMIFYDPRTPFLGYGIVCALSGALALYLPETRGKKLPNTIEELCDAEDG